MHEGTPLTSDELQEFGRLIQTIELEMAERAIASWQVSSRPNVLSEFDATAKPRTDGRKYIPAGHVAFMGDFEQSNS